jgi:SAM-dependent methyltransferase
MIETELYRQRFSKEEFEQQRAFWRPICHFLQRYVDPQGTTLDLGAGYCHFINQIESKTKIALDINQESLTRYANADVRCIAGAGSALDVLPGASLDTVFASNVYEHFQSREDVAASFAEVHRALRAGGRFIILQPNFAYCYREYFDFFDHRLVFTRHGMEEGLASAGFKTERAIDRFLPYTSKSRIPKAPWMVSLYLNVPLAWRILGGQMLLVVRK